MPEHLTGDLPGDYGFDPLKLGADKKALAWYVYWPMPQLSQERCV